MPDDPVPTFTVLSVNSGRPARLRVGNRETVTGIYKEPIATAVDVGVAGIADDTIGDPVHHGGPDQALYLFSAEDAAWWSQRLARAIPPGFFGENLTLDRFWPEPRVGDRLQIAGLQLEITFPRIPCATLAARVGDPTFVKAYVAANRPGLYARVLRPGLLRAGAPGTVRPAPSTHPTTRALFDCWHQAPRDPRFLEAALASPLGDRPRAKLEHWLGLASA